MTIEESINFLKGYLDEEVYTEKCRNAHEMAIKALEQKPILDKIKAEIDSYCSDNRDRNDGLYIAMRIIDKHLHEIESEVENMIKNAYYPCEDCECIPAFCGVDIDMCQMTCGETKPQSSEEYEAQKEERYKEIECDVECKRKHRSYKGK